MNATGKRKKKRSLPIICLAITIVILIAGLWPFNFRPKNEVTWLNGKNGIHFGRLGIAYSKEPVYGPQRAIRPGRPVSIELVVRPSREPNHSLGRILTLYTERNRQFFTLAQWKSSLILRADPQGSDLRLGSREMSASNVLVKNIPRFLTITSQNGNTAIYADGEKMKSARNFPILPIAPSSSGKLVLGTSPTGYGHWTGELVFLAAYDRELSAVEVIHHFRDWTTNGTSTWMPGMAPTLLYRFAERTGRTSRNHKGSRNDLSIPATFHVLQKTVLRPPWHEKNFSRTFVRDVVMNVLGFLPFGLLFAAWLNNVEGLQRKSIVFLVAALGGGTSITIELLQIYLPTRTSSLTDVICNLLGTIFGLYLFQWILLFLRVEKRPDL